MRLIRAAFRALGWVFTAVVAVLLACNVYTIGARYLTGNTHPTIFGWSWAIVISGSMEPEIGVNDLVVIHEQDGYRVGDVITFHSGSAIVTHRIAAESPEGFTTRGDANNTEDQAITKREDVIGRVVWVLPDIGRFIEYLRTPLGMACMVLIGFLLIEIPYLVQQHGDNDEGGGEDETLEP